MEIGLEGRKRKEANQQRKVRTIIIPLLLIPILVLSYSFCFLLYFYSYGYTVSYYPWDFDVLITNPTLISNLSLVGLVVSLVSLCIAGAVAVFSRTKEKSTRGILDNIDCRLLWDSIPGSEEMSQMTLQELNEEMTRSYVRLAILEHNIRREQINKIELEAKLNLPQPEEPSSEHQKRAKRNSSKNSPKDRKQGSTVRDPRSPISTESRHSKILSLKKSGFSFGEIGLELHLPKSTVQSVLDRHVAGTCSCMKSS